MNFLIDKNNLEQTKILQEKLLKDYGIEASLCEIQELYYKYCNPYDGDCWFDINETTETWEGYVVRADDFCKDVNERLSKMKNW